MPEKAVDPTDFLRLAGAVRCVIWVVPKGSIFTMPIRQWKRFIDALRCIPQQYTVFEGRVQILYHQKSPLNFALGKNCLSRKMAETLLPKRKQMGGAVIAQLYEFIQFARCAPLLA